ncbi:NADPH-dependent FMN reductase [Vagococcus entomophilus]|uniref:FMN reductase n=1 Tax=Vagococcus entomophilus TaxID=1160095 RepID=A0A430AJM4_9ENTE|nr:NADPH-dependent FMN reductase [Vagococcus entomophilus]RSU08312.1 FMN reductase [Vagococcus entomophilus]
MKIRLLSGSIIGTKTQIAMKYALTKLIAQYPQEDIQLLDLKELNIEFSDGRNYLDYSNDTRYLTDELMAADIILIGSPTFQASIPATLKNVFDLLPQNAFRNKVVGVLMTAGSSKHFLVAETQLKPIISYMKGYMIPNYVFIEETDFDRGTIVSDDVLFRIDKLIEDTYLFFQSYQIVWQKKEDSYDF